MTLTLLVNFKKMVSKYNLSFGLFLKNQNIEKKSTTTLNMLNHILLSFLEEDKKRLTSVK